MRTGVGFGRGTPVRRGMVCWCCEGLCLNGFVFAGAGRAEVSWGARWDRDQFPYPKSTTDMAIVASGYLFADDLAYHVDVYQGDTPADLLERHVPQALVKSSAVLDIDVPGQTVPLSIEPNEPVVVVGSSPRTSVFVYGEVPESPEGQPEVEVLPLTAATSAPPVETEPVQEETADAAESVSEAEVFPAPTVEPAPLPAAPPASPVPSPLAEPGASASAAGETKKTGTPEKPAKDERFLKTRKLRKPRAERGTRRAPRTVKIELV